MLCPQTEVSTRSNGKKIYLETIIVIAVCSSTYNAAVNISEMVPVFISGRSGGSGNFMGRGGNYGGGGNFGRGESNLQTS